MNDASQLDRPAPGVPPTVTDPVADQAFRHAAVSMGLNPDSQWIGEYVRYEWQHDRHVFETLGVPIAGARILEFGCNVGATSVVLAALGAEVVGVDVAPDFVELARLNVRRHGLSGRVEILHVDDTRQMPFADARFDVVSCNSVLEYVPHDALAAVQREIARILKPGGRVVITGTSSRLWPREVHSKKLGPNWLPRWVDRATGWSPQRGVWPAAIRSGFGPDFHNFDLLDGCRAYLEAKRRMRMPPLRLNVLRGLSRLLRPFGLTPGLVTPSIAVTLVKAGGESR